MIIISEDCGVGGCGVPIPPPYPLPRNYNNNNDDDWLVSIVISNRKVNGSAQKLLGLRILQGQFSLDWPW